MPQLPKVLFVVPPVRLQADEFEYLVHLPRHAIVLAAELGDDYDVQILDVTAEFQDHAEKWGSSTQEDEQGEEDAGGALAAELHRLVVRRISDFVPDIVAVHAHAAPHLPIVKLALDAVLDVLPHHPRMEIVIGGMAATHITQAVADWSPEGTWIVRGEATGRIRDLFSLVLGQRACDPAKESIQAIQGQRAPMLVPMEGTTMASEIVQQSAPTTARVLDILRNAPLMDYPLPRFDLLPMQTYQRLFQQGDFVPHLELGSGCTYACKFCGVHYLGAEGRFRRRPTSHVIEELSHLHKTYGFDEFYFCDETFTLDRKHVLQLCHRMKAELPGIRWRCVTRVDKVDDEVAVAMREAGCFEVGFGVEVGSSRVLEANRKEATVDSNIQAIQRIQRHGMDANALTIIGMPQEDHADIRRTFEFLAREARPNRCQIFIFHPVPGTDYFRFPELYGIRFDTRDIQEWYKWDHVGQPVCDTQFLSCEDIARYFLLFNRAFATVIDAEPDHALIDRILNNRFPIRRKGVTWQFEGQSLRFYRTTDASMNILNNTLEMEMAFSRPRRGGQPWVGYVVEFIISRCNGSATQEEIAREVQKLFGGSAVEAMQRTKELLGWLREADLVTEF